jgi:ABC-type Na+ efflux pump permease subunit
MSLLANPVLLRESRARMRGKRVFVVMAVVLAVLWIALFATYSENSRRFQNVSYSGDNAVGREMLAVLAVVQSILIGLLTPAFACGAFTMERERMTFDLLLSTTLRPRAIVLGKLASSLHYILLLVVAGFPMMSFCVLFGGVSPWQVLGAAGVMLVSAVFFASIGVWFSARLRHTSAAAAASYGAVLFLSLGLPVLMAMLLWSFDLRRSVDDDVAMFLSAIFSPVLPILSILVREIAREAQSHLHVALWVLSSGAQVLLSFLMLLHAIRRFRAWALREESGRKRSPPPAAKVETPPEEKPAPEQDSSVGG